MTLSSDLPIEKPDEDVFGLDPFAGAIAKSIEKTPSPNGVVLAVNGPWGSGKSSAINLILHHLQPAVENDELTIVRFSPWWFAGAEALTLAFFQELSIAVGPSLGTQATDAITAVGRQISAGGPVLSALANILAPGSGALVGGATGLIGKLAGSNKTVEQEHETIVKALNAQAKRFLVVIDDIDRLSPDDALTIFRLAKSVGRLPNVLYLLAFDKDLAEKAVAERFPSEGQSYLDKIVQSSFEVPPPPVDELRKQLLKAAFSVMGDPGEAGVRFMNVFYDVVAPRIRTPRDVVRIMNDVRSTWPAVADEVDRADFIGLAAIRAASPRLYRVIRDNPDKLCGLEPRGGSRQQSQQTYDRLFGLEELEPAEREQERLALRRLFPRLDSIWGNVIRTDDEGMKRDRRIGSLDHFRTYFALALAEDTMSSAEIAAFIKDAGKPDLVRDRLRQQLGKKRSSGSSRASLLLDELLLRAGDVAKADIPALVKVLFELADELDVEGDKARGFSVGDNRLRIHWLMNRLVTERFDESGRAKVYGDAMKTASLHWCCDFAERCLRSFAPPEPGRSRAEPIVSEAEAKRYGALALRKLKAAAASGALVDHGDLARLMFEWRRLAADDGRAVKAWAKGRLKDPGFVVALARAVPTVVWSQGMGFDGMGDRVARRQVSVRLDPFSMVLDTPKFEERVAALVDDPNLNAEDREALRAFRDAPREKERGVSTDED